MSTEAIAVAVRLTNKATGPPAGRFLYKQGSGGGCKYRLAPLPASDDSSPWPPGNSGDGALANVAFESTSYNSFTEEVVQAVELDRVPALCSALLRQTSIMYPANLWAVWPKQVSPAGSPGLMALRSCWDAGG